MGQFHRIAKRGVLPVNAFLGRIVGHKQVVTQFGKEIRIQRVIRVDQKAAINTHISSSLNAFFPGSSGRVFIENEILAQPHQIQFSNIVTDFVTQIVVAVAGAAEGMFLTIDLDHRNFAAPVAFFLAALTGERSPVGHRTLCQHRQVKRFFLHQAAGHPFFNLEGDAEGPHEAGFRRNDDRFSRKGGHGKGNGPVVADPSLHEYLFTHRPVSFHAVDVIHADGIDQAGDNVCMADAQPLCVADVKNSILNSCFFATGPPDLEVMGVNNVM